MATSKPRLTITFTPRQHAVLKSISESGGRPISALVSELIEECLPTLERMAATFQALRRAQDVNRQQMADALARAQDAIEPIAMRAAGQFDIFLGQVESAAGAVVPVSGSDTSPMPAAGDKSPASGAAALLSTDADPADPRPVITGVNKTKRTATRGKRRGVA